MAQAKGHFRSTINIKHLAYRNSTLLNGGSGKDNEGSLRHTVNNCEITSYKGKKYLKINMQDVVDKKVTKKQIKHAVILAEKEGMGTATVNSLRGDAYNL